MPRLNQETHGSKILKNHPKFNSLLRRFGNRKEFLRLVLEKIPLVVLAAAGCIVTAATLGLGERRSLPFSERVSNALVSYVVYIRQMLLPSGLAAPYPLAPNGQPMWKVLIALAVLLAISITVIALRTKRPYLLMGWLWYLGMAFPVIGIIQISSDAAHADRYTYLPEIGLAIAGVWVLKEWSAKWKYRRALCACVATFVLGVLIILARNQTSDWRDSEALWSHALACTSQNSTAHYGLGVTLFKQGKNDEALAHLRQAIQINPGFAKAYAALGAALLAKGEKEEAIAQYRQSLKIDPSIAEIWENLGSALLKIGEKEEAVAEYRKSLEIDPKFSEAHYNLGCALLQEENVGEAIIQFQAALQTAPRDSATLRMLGVAWAMKGHNEEAIAAFRQAIAVNRASVEAYDDLGAILIQTGKLEEGLGQYRVALQIDPKDAEACFGIGKALLRGGDFDGALASFEKATVLGNTAFAKWRDVGNALLQSEDWEEAVICYQHAATINPRTAEIYANLGFAYFRGRENKQARDSWQKSLEIDPNQPNVQQRLAWLLATSPDGSLRDGTKAVALAEAANRSTAGESPLMIRTLAAAYAEVGQYPKAAATARRALELAAAHKNKQLTSTFERDLKSYERGAPVRDTVQ
jgi:tetratricopeptide (TPR) repeat protein